MGVRRWVRERMMSIRSEEEGMMVMFLKLYKEVRIEVESAII